MESGTVFTFQLGNNLHGACRVIRESGKSDLGVGEGKWLVCATRFFGDPALALKDPNTKKILKTIRGPAVYWFEGGPPSGFQCAGVIATPKADLVKTTGSHAPWEIFPNIVYEQWRQENEPDALAAARKANLEHAERELQTQLEHVLRTEHIDLAGLVPLVMPKTERQPVEVLQGFIAAMHQWEQECERLDRKTGNLGRMVIQAAEKLIFDEFCTPKERKYGRLGSYSSPPEYDPASEEIVSIIEVSPRRVEIETQQHAGFKHRLKYVLLKQKKMWLIDSKIWNGNPEIL